jgi:hypothetical protein
VTSEELHGHVAGVFEERRYWAPKRQALLDITGAMKATQEALEDLGFRRLGISTVPNGMPDRPLLVPPPRYSADPFFGQYSYADYVAVEPDRAERFLLLLSRVAPLFTASDDSFHMVRPGDNRRIHPGSRRRLDASPYRNVIASIQRVLAPRAVDYVAFEASILNEPVDLTDLDGATLRDCLFAYDPPE